MGTTGQAEIAPRWGTPRRGRNAFGRVVAASWWPAAGPAAGERERDTCRQRGVEVDAQVVDLGGGAMASWTCASTASIRSAVGVAAGKRRTSAMPSALSLGRQ